ncbi:uncharacterized protein B0T15DRAFT_8968 [Chaetomium strumarium]|uniref:DUF7580 domain-containing protein n=1 Tax=Chaetomium strumarium TaxID=1170767 RepID=A0AAJ0H0Q6_9PEZI|nr:hypothetical protein B0T15DRAFT_8968 [Chaetomium strumarium]
MSGFEVAGVVLGTLPLVITAVEAYINFLKDWGRITSELKSIHRQLTTERAKLYNVCDQLLGDVVPQKDIEPMLADPFGPLWQHDQTKTKIRRRLWNSYDSFEETVLEIQKALETVQQRLRIDVTDDGQVKWVEKSWMPREFRKFLYRLDRKDYQEALTVISKGVNDLEVLIRLSVALEPNRRKRAGGRLTNILRELSRSVYRALRSSIQCSDPHDIGLGLLPRFADIGYDEEEDEKILSETHFRVAISSETTDDRASERRKLWDEVNIKRMPFAVVTKSTAPPELTTQSSGPMTTRKKRAKFVAFARDPTSYISAGRPRGGLTYLVTEMTQQMTEITFIQPPADDASVAPLELCSTLKKARCAPLLDCYGHLVDPEQPTHHFKVYPLTNTVTKTEAWSLVTLDDILRRKPGVQPLLWLEEKVRLALSIASSVLQLSTTPWLPAPLTKEDVYFFVKDGQPAYQQAFLWKQVPESIGAGSDAKESPTYHQHHNALFCLGILLLEIILGSTIDSLREPHEEIQFQGDDFGVIRDSITAHRLLQTKVALINPAYKAVVERCVGCGASQGLDEEAFRERVYNGVVAELEAIWQSTKLS